MIHVYRQIQLSDTEVMRNYSLHAGKNIRIYTAGARFNNVDKTSLPSPLTSLRSSRVQQTVVLKGEYSIIRNGKVYTLFPGDTVYEKTGSGGELWEGTEVKLLVIEWECLDSHDTTFGQISRLYLPSVFSCLENLSKEQSASANEFFRLLSLTDIPDRSLLETFVNDAFNDPALAQLAPIASVLSKALCNLSTSPMWIDFIQRLEISERQARRQMSELLKIMGMPDSHTSLRSYLNRVRLSHAISFFNAKNTTVNQIAGSLGYSSDRALATALRNAGLGNPSSLKGCG
ncbi:hypothetical protein KKF34_13755 [Myxococcota bacterium]|nr:hypothetical protein [Myxococcota bacterium]MBU1382502.1 hypothetical protein [Myxococcota bacterium]MBU1497936.1 hypothetical protein [Myxococcota bacterium]